MVDAFESDGRFLIVSMRVSKSGTPALRGRKTLSPVSAKKGEGRRSYVRSVSSQVLDDRRSLATQVMLDEELTRLQMQ